MLIVLCVCTETRDAIMPDASKAAKRAEIAARVARARAFELEQAAALASVTPIVNDVASLSLLKRGSGATEWAFAERAATAPPAACMREPLRSLEARFRAAHDDPKKPYFWWNFDEALGAIGRELERSNHCILDGFLGVTAVRPLRDEITGLYRDGKLQLSRMAGGRAGDMLKYSQSAVRGDHVGWFDGTEGASTWPRQTLASYLQKVDALVAALARHNAQLASIVHRSKAMVACYPGGGSHYVRHCDNSCESGRGERCNGRRLTAILYLNESWHQLHGGELRLYPPFAHGAALCDVAPLADRLLLFYADYRVPHEVMPAHVPRLAVTLWYFDREEHAKARATGVALDGLEHRETDAIEAEIARFEERYGKGSVRSRRA